MIKLRMVVAMAAVLLFASRLWGIELRFVAGRFERVTDRRSDEPLKRER